RTKEDSDDYRYFPCPDLPVVSIAPSLIDSLRSELPELPDEKSQRFQDAYLFSKHDATILVANRNMADYFEAVLEHGIDPKTAANWIMGDVSRLLNENGTDITECRVTADKLAGLIKQIDTGVISGKIAKTVFEEMFQSGREAAAVIQEKGLKQVSDSDALTGICETILADNPTQVEQFREGKEKVMGFFVGQVMKLTKGKANPQMVNEILRELLKK
ncbi:MAG: Asp-tRNA(Asn)/Glu-tRNA(Gln) amidotransferase GatCAB subunit B, partial [bacterium]